MTYLADRRAILGIDPTKRGLAFAFFADPVQAEPRLLAEDEINLIRLIGRQVFDAMRPL